MGRDLRFSDEFRILMVRSEMGKVSPETLSDMLEERGLKLSAASIRSIVNDRVDAHKLSADVLEGMSEILTGDPTYLFYRLGFYQNASKESFAAADAIYRRIYGK